MKTVVVLEKNYSQYLKSRESLTGFSKGQNRLLKWRCTAGDGWWVVGGVRGLAAKPFPCDNVKTVQRIVLKFRYVVFCDKT